MGTADSRRVYVIDDDKGVLDSSIFLLCALGYEPLGFERAQAFADEAAALPPGCIVTDLRMPDMDGFELAAALRQRGVGWPILMITSENGKALEKRASASGFAALLHKPIDADLLAVSLAEAFTKLDG